MAEIRDLLDEVIETEIRNLEYLEPGSQEKAAAVNTLATLHKLRIEEIKVEADADERDARLEGEEIDRERDEKLKQRQFKDGKIDRYVRLAASVAELVVPLMFYATWMKMGFEFEKEGTFTSLTFKNLLSRFRPTHKG